MNEKNITLLNDNDFDILLQKEFSELSPENVVVNRITPWKKYMKYVLWGIFFTTVNNHIELIAYIGSLMMILGFRGLRKENKWFMTSYVIKIISFIIQLIHIIINASILNNEILTMPYVKDIFNIGLIFTPIIYICLWQGIRCVEKKSNITHHSKSPISLIIWYLIALIVALNAPNFLPLVILLIIAYFIIFISLYKLYKSLITVGYSIKPATIKVSNLRLVCIIFALMGISIIVVSLSNHYPMNWVINKENHSTAVKDAKSQLTDLGVPKHVLDDLSDEELLAFGDASYAIVREEDNPLNEGRQVKTENGNGTSVETVYDVYELHTTQVALRMSDDGNTWRIINHFKWNEKTYFTGTEAITLTGEQMDDINGEITGRLLYRKNGKTYSSEFHSISKEPHTHSFFDHTCTSTYIFAGFSFNKIADDYSGYLTHEIVGKYGNLNDAENKPSIYVEMDYYHQQALLLYPAITSLDYAKKGYYSWNNDKFEKPRVSFEFVVTDIEVTP